MHAALHAAADAGSSTQHEFADYGTLAAGACWLNIQVSSSMERQLE